MFTYILLVATVSYQNVFAQIGMGPVRIKLVEAHACEGDKGFLDITINHLDVKHQAFTMDINLPRPLDDTITYEVRLDKKAYGQIEEGVFFHGKDTDLCEELYRIFGNVIVNMFDASGIPQGCPTPAGKYHVEKFPFNEHDMNLKDFLYGRFLFNLEIFADGVKVVCQVIEFTNSRPGESF